LTLAAPGGLDWWPDEAKSLERPPELLQRRVPSQLHALTVSPQATTQEGLGTLGTPEYTDEPTWLTPVPQPRVISTQTGGGTGTPPGSSTSTVATTTSSQPSGAPVTQSGTEPLAAPNTRGQPATIAAAHNSEAAAAKSAVAGPNTPSATTAPATGGVASTAITTQNHQPLISDPTGDQSHEPRQLPFWMESAIHLGTRFLRIAAGGIPQAGLRFVPHGDEPHHACCHECGHEHPMLVDEYYFWLTDTRYYAYTDETDVQTGAAANFTGSYRFGFQDSFYDEYQQQSAEWNDEDQVPQLLAKWQPNPAVRLAWCRVHNGQFQPPRKSVGYVPISSPADLIFLGRAEDSLYFQVFGGTAPPPPGYKDTSPPGFRFDLPANEAVALPQVTLPPTPPGSSPYPGGLLSYPFFAYEDPGARLFPDSWCSPAILVADALRVHCRFDLALQWYQRAFDPLQFPSF
jgi:hypothetical protein